MSNLKKLRIASGLTQCELANSIGQTQSSICHYESGRRVPDIVTCGVTPERFQQKAPCGAFFMAAS